MRERGTRPAHTPTAAAVRRTVAPPPVAARLLALQRTAGNAAVAAMLAPGALTLQRVAAQIGLAPDGVTIGDLTVRGRPESPFKGTMGDHTTAFVVQAQSVRNAVVGRRPGAAVRGILKLVDKAGRLPGAALIANLDTEHAGRLKEAHETTMELADRIAGLRADDPRLVTTLQSLVTAYLHYRELIPLSTLNIKSVSAGLAGRGKGEAGAVRGMAGHREADPASLKESIKGLLDFQGLAILATQHRSAVATIAPGIDPAKRIDPILAQHLGTISAAYPGAVLRAWGGLRAALEDLRATLDPYIETQKARNVEVYNGLLVGAYDRRLDLRADRIVAKPGAWVALDTQLLDLDEEIRRHRKTVRANGGTPVAPPDPSAARRRNPPTRYGSEEDEAQSRKRKREPERPPKPPRWIERDVEELPGRPVATQVVLDEHGVITELYSEGRPPSALPSGKMGAHTTAWLVHKDVIRTALLGKTVPDAIAELPALGARSEAIGVRFRTVGRSGEPSIAGAMRLLVGNADRTPAAHLPLLLQDGVNQILAYINKIPGVARDVVNTKGNREGEWRGILLRRERGEPVDAETLRTSLLGLLDVRGVADAAEREMYLRNHLVQVRRAYPQSYADSGLDAMNVTDEVLPLVRTATSRDKKKRKGV